MENITLSWINRSIDVEIPYQMSSTALSRRIDWMKMEFRFKFAALALQLN